MVKPTELRQRRDRAAVVLDLFGRGSRYTELARGARENTTPEGLRPMSRSVELFAKGLEFAARKHVNQRRKGELQEPYINHLSEVTHLLSGATGGHDTVLVLGGLLHDTLEDTDTTYSELKREFGEKVAALVREVSDDKTLPKAKRKLLQVENAPKKSKRAKMLKMADKISNLQSILNSPPTGWSDQRKREYFEWSKAVVAGCRGVNEQLEKEFDRAYRRGRRVFR